MNPDTFFWQAMRQLLLSHLLIVDRPRGTHHPRFSDMIYPLDYGYLENTTSGDGGGIDVWVGSLNRVMNQASAGMLTGILCTFDTLKRDAEIKLLLACSEADIQVIRDFHKELHSLYIPNPMVENDLSN